MPINTTVSITFDTEMDASTLTTNTSDTQCRGNFKISADDFETCVRMKGSPTPSDSNQTFTITPLNKLDYSTRYMIRITTGARDTNGYALQSEYTSSAGFRTWPVWAWVSGSNMINQTGVYGSKRVTSTAHTPGCRYGSVSWIDSPPPAAICGSLAGMDMMQPQEAI